MRHFGVSSTKSGLKDVTGKCWEQDLLVGGRMAADADRHEYLYGHDTGVARVRKLMADEAE